MSTAPVAPPTARRFWAVVACFAVANAVAWFAVDRHAAGRHGTLRVESFEPGEDVAVDPSAAVRWRFTDDVIPTDVHQRPPGTSTPAVAGRWAWESPRTLAFTPATALPRAVPVTFTLATDLLRTATGASLKQPFVARVRPAPLAVVAARQSAVLDDGFVVEFTFTDRVPPGDVLAHLTATGPDGHGVGCHLFGQVTGNRVAVRTDPLELPDDGRDGSLHVELSAGLTGTAGPLGLTDPFRATLPLTRHLSATALTATNYARGKPYLHLSFTGPVDPADLKQVLSVDPPVPFTIVSEGTSVDLTGDFAAGTRYAVRLADPPAHATVADRRRFPRPGTLSAFVPDANRDCWFDQTQGYLSTAGTRAVVAHVVNVDQLRVTITRVYDDNLVTWRNAAANRSSRSANTDAYARPAARRTVRCPGPKNARRDVRLALDDLLPPDLARTGAWRIAIDAVAQPNDNASDDGSDEPYRYRGYDDRAACIVTLSDVGLTAKRTRDGVVAWATSLRTATPLAGVRVRAYTDKNQLLGSAVTAADGLARLPDLHPAAGETVAILLADATTDGTTRPSAPAELTWLDLRRTGWDLADADTAGQPYLRTGHAAYAFSDRGVYRPGETVRLRAIVRAPGDVAPAAPFPVRWRFRRPDLHDWRTVPAMLDADGATAVDVPLPADLPTGEWTADVGLAGDDAHPFGTVTFAVEEFIPNRLKVAATFGSNPRVTADAQVPLDVQADYLFGRPAAGLTATVTTRAVPVSFAPAGWEGWTFGDAADVRSTPSRKAARPRRDQPPTDAHALDDAGHYRGTVDVADVLHADDQAGPWRLTAAASVAEAGGRAVTIARSVDVDAVAAYLAVRRATDATPAPGEPCPVRLARVRPDGSPATEPADVTARLLRVTWNTVTTMRNGQYAYDSTRVFTPVAKATVSLTDGTGQWAPIPPAAGSYVVEASDGTTTTTSAFYAASGYGWDDAVDRSHPDRLDVRLLGPGEPDRPAADARTRPAVVPRHVGDTARVLISAPFAGRLLLTVETDDVVQSQVIDMPTSHVVVPVTVTAACRPGAFVTATVIRPVTVDSVPRPHRAYGVARLDVDPADRKLTVAIAAPAELRPMQSLDVGLTVTDPAGHPVPDAAVAVTAVDEGICSLTNFATPDPLAHFTSHRALGVSSADAFDLLLPEPKASNVGGDGAKFMGSGGMARHQSPIGGRRVRPVALGWMLVHTDAAGHAAAAFPVPAFQGRLRVMAVAYTPDRLGSADRGVVVRSPLSVQTSWPRFAAPGDRFTVPVVLFNNRAVGGTARVTVTPVEHDDLLTVARPMVDVPLAANGQARIDLPVTVADRVGVARMRLTADLAGEQFTEDVELPVRPAAPTSQFGGVARGSPSGPVSLAGLVPVVPGTNDVRVDVTPWPTLNLHRGLDYLNRYPYGCAEQTTSTLFPLVALGDIGRKLDPATFDPTLVRDKVDAGLTRLLGMQTADGGLAMWPGMTDAWPWASVYAAHFCTVARGNGYAVPDDFYDHLTRYVRHLLDQGTDAADGLEVQAYAAYVLALAGRPERPAMSRLGELAAARRVDRDPVDAYAQRADAQLFLAAGWLLAGRRDLAEDMLPTAVAPPRAARQHGGNLGSTVRDRAVLVLALEQVEPDRADLPDLVQKLADARWSSTQDVAFATLAIGQHLRAEAGRHRTPYTAATLLAGTTVLAKAQARPLAWAGDPAVGPLSVRLDGPADAVGHVAWLQTGVPLTPPPAASHGLTVRRQYTTVDDRPIGSTVATGDLVRVVVDLDGPGDLDNVVVDDLLPAGLEVENARLATAAHDDEGTATFGSRTDVRDDRVVVVGRIGSAGHGRFTYLARAVTPGTYVVPPVRAEAMYDLDTNGTSATSRLTVTGGPTAAVANR